MKLIDEKEFVRALNAVASTDDGQIVLAMIRDYCQWDKTYIASDNPTISHYYAVKRGVYGGLRERIRPQFLKLIEFEYKRKVETKDDRAIASRERVGKQASRNNP